MPSLSPVALLPDALVSHVFGLSLIHDGVPNVAMLILHISV